MPRVRLSNRPAHHLVGCECDGCYAAGFSAMMLEQQIGSDPEVRAMEERHSIERRELFDRLRPNYIAED